jgi:septum formation protein
MGLQFVLASASPARRRLLQLAGIDPVIRPSDVDESQIPLTDPEQVVTRLAIAKAKRVAEQLQPNLTEDCLVLGCDSVLALHGEIHGKPANPNEAFQRWQQMRGTVGDLYTGHALIYLTPNNHPPQTRQEHRITRVYFANPSDRELQAYIATGEPLSCAGAFALEGYGGLFVDRLDGCHSNVIGLSLPLLRQMMQTLDVEVTQFWQPKCPD